MVLDHMDGGWIGPGGEGGLEITSENDKTRLAYGKTIPVANLVSKVGALIPKNYFSHGKIHPTGVVFWMCWYPGL